MAKAKLRQILAADKGKVPYLERQKKLQKEARKRKRVQDEKEEGSSGDEEEDEEMKVDGEWESDDSEDDSEDDERVIDMSKLEDSDSEEEDEGEDEDEDEDEEEEEETKKAKNGILKSSKATTATTAADEDDEEEDEEDEEDIPLSEISEEDHDPEADIIPRQKLTIDNHSALTASQSSIAIPIKKSTPFSTHHTIVTSTPVEIKDVHDDLTRELAFYAQALDAAKQGRALLLAEGAPFTRPTDYFAEMVKSEEHMGKIKEKIKEQAAMKQASADAKRQRDLKKFGKQVQVARLQERQKEKREMLDKINVLKRKRAGADMGDENEGDPFDIAIEKAEKVNGREGRDRRGPNAKRQKKNEKFGFGGRKKFSKSGDAASSGDLTGFNSKGMKKNSFGSGKKAKAPRPGKSKRQGRR
ncbi:rRNA-processing protein and EBNA1-binding protein ebp2 [Arthrobotrys musiformis]|uniref:rRNA-processing protein and EBNA1-binding protein ebp2 n=1 Tax=Arthrobotrys musiformis TaxID=47236 RepID=A0AAV9WPC4_9PEZI